MIWRTQYSAIMTLIFLAIGGLAFYTGDYKDILINGWGYQLIIHVFFIVANFITLLFGKPLFYEYKIIE